MAAVNPIIAVIGPTASGKSALAFALARWIGGEVLCVDSMTVYRGMDVGTAKPLVTERASVPHHLIDVVDPSQTFAVAEFVTRADAVIADAASRRVPLVAVGGTPMYFKALFEGLFDGPGADLALRETLAATPLSELREELRRVDPDAAHRIEGNDIRRIVRALEVFRLTGRSITAQQQEWGRQVRHPATWVGLSWEKEALNRRVNVRTKAMMAAGWLDEVRNLVEQYGTLSRTAAMATGYAQLLDHLRGEMSFDDAVEATKVATRQLASRQMKWFRRFEGVRWIDGADEESIEKAARSLATSS